MPKLFIGWLVLLIVMATTPKLYAQSGFDLIRAADQAVEDEHYAKAKKYLEDAAKADYGFCGNAWNDAFTFIQETYFRMYLKQGEYAEARKTLMEIDEWFSISKPDSLVLMLYIGELGAPRILQDIDSGLASMHYDDDRRYTQAVIPLGADLVLMLPAPLEEYPYKPRFIDLDEAGLRAGYAQYFHESGLYRALTQPLSLPKESK